MIKKTEVNGIEGMCVATRHGGKWVLKIRLGSWIIDDILAEVATTGSFLVNTLDQPETTEGKWIELSQALPLLTPPYP